MGGGHLGLAALEHREEQRGGARDVYRILCLRVCRRHIRDAEGGRDLGVVDAHSQQSHKWRDGARADDGLLLRLVIGERGERGCSVHLCLLRTHPKQAHEWRDCARLHDLRLELTVNRSDAGESRRGVDLTAVVARGDEGHQRRDGASARHGLAVLILLREDVKHVGILLLAILRGCLELLDDSRDVVLGLRRRQLLHTAIASH